MISASDDCVLVSFLNMEFLGWVVFFISGGDSSWTRWVITSLEVKLLVSRGVIVTLFLNIISVVVSAREISVVAASFSSVTTLGE
jgi:hypothetical protein